MDNASQFIRLLFFKNFVFSGPQCEIRFYVLSLYGEKCEIQRCLIFISWRVCISFSLENLGKWQTSVRVARKQNPMSHNVCVVTSSVNSACSRKITADKHNVQCVGKWCATPIWAMDMKQNATVNVSTATQGACYGKSKRVWQWTLTRQQHRLRNKIWDLYLSWAKTKIHKTTWVWTKHKTT